MKRSTLVTPSEIHILFPTCIKKAVDDILSKSDESGARDRTAEFRRWAVMTERLRCRESAIRSNVNAKKRTVLKEKSLALFERLISVRA